MNVLKEKHYVPLILKAISIVGGAKELSNHTDTSYQSVLDWKNGRKSPSPINCIKIEKATEGKVKARELLPNYSWEKLR